MGEKPVRHVVVFGATGMIGQGLLRECLADPHVQTVRSIGRSTTGQTHPKLTEILHADLFHYEAIAAQLTGVDACFFCLGTPSPGKTEAEYSHITYDLTLAAAEALLRQNPGLTFVYVSAEGADPSEKGPIMWARVRGRLENQLLRMPFGGIYIFRPGVVQPLDGIHSRTPAYRNLYILSKPILPLWRKLLPKTISTTQEIGRAMLNAARFGSLKKIHRTPDFGPLARAGHSA